MGSPDKDTNDLESPLGIAQEPIAQTPEDHLPDTGDAGSRRRRARALGEDGIERQPGDQTDEHDGATGIDMGYGGDGTNIKPSR